MSLPKEPRQLMINLMYIVLTAMLALNVSAEVLNAFLTMDKSIGESSRIVGDSNAQLFKAIEKQVEAYSQFAPFKEKAAKAQILIKEFYDYTQALKDELIASSGGLDEHNQPVSKKKKEPTSYLFINQGKGEELKNKIIEVRQRLLDLVEDENEKALLSQVLPLELQPIPEDSDKKTWAAFTFQQMPVAAVLPILSKFQNDARIAESAILSHFYGKVKGEDVVFDEYIAVVSADKSYVIKGEPLSSEIFLSAFSTTASNISIKVNGRPLEVKNGKALFNIRPSEIGSHSFLAEVSITNPINQEVKTYTKRFNYEVGERSVTASADKMNVFYLGVDNPFSVSAAGVPSKDVQVSSNDVRMEKIQNGKYNVKPKRLGKAKIIVSGGGLETTFEYRVKKIPDPVIRLGRKGQTSMKPNEFKAFKGLVALLENFDFEARCNIVGFELTRLPKKGDANMVVNRGGKYTSDTKALVNQARYGDTFFFDQIRVRCPGDEASRKING
ncbi:MAG TPA: gliding motility protein GldM, partial [Phaeodactylibacter sp.]|nr:gliding motility protein GldM [Phaeodactylibacter sp.]